MIGMKIYYTVDNGGAPYKVLINDELDNIKVDIHKLERGCGYTSEPIYSCSPKKIFIGKSIINKMTIFSGSLDKDEWDGNSILFCINEEEKQYVYVGECIYSFTSEADITEYYSPVGNSCVPYPYAIDQKGNYYLMIEDAIIANNADMEELEKNNEDPYTYYYNYNCISKNFAMKKVISSRR
jgi:hypothetical protein